MNQKQAIEPSGPKYYRELSKQNKTCGIWFTIPLSQESANIFVWGQIVNILGFVAIWWAKMYLLTPALSSS